MREGVRLSVFFFASHKVKTIPGMYKACTPLFLPLDLFPHFTVLRIANFIHPDEDKQILMSDLSDDCSTFEPSDSTYLGR